MEHLNFDLIVIGTGTAASTAADQCAEMGWKVAQIDELPFGGTCAQRGCDPKKILVGAADLVDWNRRMGNRGISSNAVIDWKQLMKFKRSFTDPVPVNKENGMKKAGIVPFHGHARFEDEKSVKVGNYILTGKHILIATGARPAPLPIQGFEHLVSSTDFLELEELPDKIVFVGGGYISFEFAFIAALAGAEVRIVHRGSRPLEGFDHDLVAILLEKAKELGIEVYLNSEVISVEKNGEGFLVNASQNDSMKQIAGNLVVHGAGRIPNIDQLFLEKGNVEFGKKGIIVNQYLQSISNPGVYAAGDVSATDGKPLTPVTGFESRIAAENLLFGNCRIADYPAQPTVVFTIPPLASVGLSEDEAGEKGYEFEIITNRIENWYSYKRINESHAAFKTIVEKETGKILGAHLLGTKAEELINIFTLAINQGTTVTDLKEMIYAYPTHGSDIPYMVG